VVCFGEGTSDEVVRRGTERHRKDLLKIEIYAIIRFENLNLEM